MKGIMPTFGYVLFACLIGLGLSSRVYAFDCYNNSDKVTNSSKTFTQQIVPVSLSKNTLDATVINMSSYAYCYGDPGPNYYDALRTTSLTISESLTSLGFAGYVQYNGGTKYDASSNQVCIWPDNSCTIASSSGSKSIPIYATVGIKRSSGSGAWQSGMTIPAGTEIARLVTQMRIMKSWSSAYVTWSFILKSDLVIPAYTCSITQYDKSVTLPDVRRSDIIANGTGRYPNAKKEFKFDLACEPQTSVSVTFDGDTLSGTGTDSVLKNKLNGNDNVGIQLLFNDSTPVKMTEKLEVASSAQSSQLLNFNAYYYYKGGEINNGPIKANTTFTFEYQ